MTERVITALTASLALNESVWLLQAGIRGTGPKRGLITGSGGTEARISGYSECLCAERLMRRRGSPRAPGGQVEEGRLVAGEERQIRL